MQYDFDRRVDRRGTDSSKWDYRLEKGYTLDTLPMWVADMDIPAPPAVAEAICRAARHNIYGYTKPKEPYYEAVRRWFASRHGYSPLREWQVLTPGVVFALSTAVQAYTAPGEGVLLQRPVYYPFTRAVERNGRVVVNSALVLRDGAYAVDWADFEAKAARPDVRLFLLCSPHNPVGRVWTREELARMGEICRRNGVVVVSDEIHCDFAYAPAVQTMFPTLGEADAMNCVLCTAPSKTFNLAGLQDSNIFIRNPALREPFQKVLGREGYSELNLLGLAAARAAYEEGGEWLDQLLVYLRGNLDFARSFTAQHLPGVRLVEPQGTYLLWFDLRGLGLDHAAQEQLVCRRARLWLDDGVMFGPEGEGFWRLNMACPRSLLAEALQRLADALAAGA